MRRADDPGSNGTIKVINAYPLSAAQRRRLDSVDPRLQVEHHRLTGPDEIDALVDEDVSVLLANLVPSDLTQTPSLRWLQYSGAGIDPPLKARAPWDHGIVVTTASGGNSLPIGEYVMTSILAVAQRIEQRREHQRLHRWEWDQAREQLFGRPLRGAMLALVGYGSIGREVARLASAFGMRILAVKARPAVREDERWCVLGTGDPTGRIPERIVGADDLEDAVGQADYVVATVPSTSATRGALGRRILAAMPSTAWLINVGRGDLFDEDDLADALEQRRIAGATLDVTGTEPLPPESRLWDLSSTVITPHIAGGSPDVWERLSELFADNLRRYAVGEPLANVYRPELEY